MNDMKKCNKCGKGKPKSRFGKKKGTADGLRLYCRKCSILETNTYHKTLNGLLTRMYSTQRCSSRQRDLPMPKYNKSEMIDWLRDNTDFIVMYYLWKSSGYQSDKLPSIDRLDDNKPYSIDNIRLCTWKVNSHKEQLNRKNGINNKHNRAVVQMTLDDIYIHEFYSINEAHRQTGINNIGGTCRGIHLTAGGFKWKYADSL